MKIEGLDELTKKLDSLATKAKELDGTHSVSISDVLTPAFIVEHTRFSTINELFAAGGFECETQGQFEAIPEGNLDDFIRAESPFESWQDMLGAAGQRWAASKLGL